jgi:hypothetical protein
MSRVPRAVTVKLAVRVALVLTRVALVLTWVALVLTWVALVRARAVLRPSAVKRA